MTPRLFYPDLTPPPQWGSFRTATQIRLIPPGTTQDDAQATIIVSPLIGRHDRLPPVDKLMEMAIDAEAKAQLEISERGALQPFKTTSELQGWSLELKGFARPAGHPEHRLYVMVSDATCYYGINYLASEAAFPKFVDIFWTTARSILPFAGRVIPPTGGATPHGVF